MKIKNLSTIAIVAAALVSSCAGNEKKQDNAPEVNKDYTVELRSYSYDGIAEMTKDSLISPDYKYWRLSGNGILPVRIGNNDITALRDTLMAMGHVSLKENASKPEMREGLTETKISPDSLQSYSFTDYKLSVELMTPGVIVWRSYGSGYTQGAAHGIYANRYLNYSPVYNKVITLADLMQPGYEEPLLDMIREQLKDNKSVIVPTEEIKIPEDFRITNDGIAFIYGIYEIAPYSEGEIEVRFNVGDLAEILKPEAADMISGSEY